MLEFILLSLALIGILSVLRSSKLRTSVVIGALAILFMPFGILVAIGWIIPKISQVLLPYLPLKDVVS